MKQTVNTNGIQRKILFVTMPADGHFSPLTSLAKHLQSVGHDVRWYTQDYYKEKLAALQIQYYPHVNALQLNQTNFEGFFTERTQHKSQAAKFKFDLQHIFIEPAPLVLKDIEDIYKSFPFELVIADIMSFSIPLIRKTFKIPVIAAGIIPLMETSVDLPPTGLGLMPSDNSFGRFKQAVLRKISDAVIFKKPNKLFRQQLASYSITAPAGNVFDILYRSADVVLQSGTPGFEYYRSDIGSNIHFAGSLLPYSNNANTGWFDERLKKYRKVILVTQGTVEKDVTKIIVPALEAFKNDTKTLVVCTTGGSQTAALRQQYLQDNIIIEDFIPFGNVMPFASAYITNGGYGGVMLGIKNKLPLVVAGVHEGKNEICARIGYFKYGINLKTETPSAEQLVAAIEEVTSNRVYRKNIEKLAREFTLYNPEKLCEKFVEDLLQKPVLPKQKIDEMAAELVW